MNAPPIKLVLVDDHALVRQGLADLLSRGAGMQVMATTGRADEAWDLLQQHRPDLLILDLRMAPTDGISLLKSLRDKGSDTPVLVLTMSEAAEDLAAALRLGVRGYLLKDMEPADVIDAIRRAARGELVVAPSISGKLATILQTGEEPGSAASLAKQLTGRERQILGYVASGLSNKAIARTLGISNDTVKLHVRHILAKLGLSSRVEAAVFAVQNRAALGMQER
ncbi:MAG TPA: response regulator transcription factor [Burkholderiaceae bacterium]|nr:response regulator transcription factor [Burkholderiaceae bacterium]HQR71490.1 response regulator transcription factor [Burkholderiaceae bacterium]